jgi:hypothetical protein
MTRSLTLAVGLLGLASVAWAQEDEPMRDGPAREEQPRGAEPRGSQDRTDTYFIGYETEPAMDAGGRTLASFDRAGSVLLDKLLRADRRSWLRPIWEVPLTLPMMMVLHEGFGHGGRARELGLSASYGATAQGAYTQIEETPESNSDIALICGGGSEANGIMARRLLLDAHRPRGASGSTVPLYLVAKFDLPLYIWETVEPKPAPPELGNGPSASGQTGSSESFVEQYTSGNDIAGYLVARQAQRLGGQPQAAWDGTYEVDFGERRIVADWHDLRTTAIWTAADPALIALLYSYVRDHIIRHDPHVRPLSIPLGHGVGLSFSTRAALAPTYLTRFLDVLVTLPRGVAYVYARDLDSHEDRGYGFGAGIERFELTRQVTLGLSGDIWREPNASEGASRRDCWNVTAEADLLLSRRVGLSLTTGAKSEGYFPGRPSRDGFYLGMGALVVF